MPKHIPRRSGVVGTDSDHGPRQVLPPKEETPRRRFRGAGPELCGVKHPDLDLTCTGRTHVEQTATGALVSRLMGLPFEPATVDHRGKHRARILDGIVVRWENGQ